MAVPVNIDPVFVERVVVGGLLAAAAVLVAFGPELGRLLVRVRSRPEVALGAERVAS